MSQSSRRNAFPDALRGTAVTNAIDRGSLNVANAGRRNARSSSAETSAPGFSATTALGTSPRIGSGAASTTRVAERGLAPSAVPVLVPPHVSDYTSVQRRIQSFLPINDNSPSATSQPKQEFSDNPVGAEIQAEIPAAIGNEETSDGVSPIAV